MIFSYKTLSKSISIEFDIDNIDAHKLSIIRGLNTAANGTRIHDEVIDESLIQLTGENTDEDELIARTVNTAPFTWDPDAGEYVGNQLNRIIFYENGTGIKQKYISYIPGISSNIVPYKLLSSETIIIKFIQFSTSFLASGNIIDILDNNTGAILFSLDIGATSTLDYFTDVVNHKLIGPVDLSVYVNNNRLDNPSLIIGVRKVYEV